MNDPQLLITAGGILVVTQAATALGVGLLKDYISNGKCQPNGHCKDHTKISMMLETLIDAHKEEKRVDVLAKALEKALKQNGKMHG